MAQPPIDYTKGRSLTSDQEQREERLVKDFESALARLKNEYYLFFIGTNPKPPYKQRNDLDNTVRQIQRDLPKRTAQRFKMQQLLIRYQHMAEHWDRSLRGLESGERMAWVPISKRPPQSEAEEKAGAPPAASNGSAERSAYLAALRDPGSQEEDVRKIYNSYMAARAKTGTEGGPSFEKFQQVVAKQTQAIMDKGAQAVQFRVEISEDKVALKAKAVKD